MKTNKNIFFTSWPLFVTLLLAIGAALGQDASLPDPMPTITPTPTVNPLLRKLQTQLSFGFGGGCGDCGINECSTEALGNWNPIVPAIVPFSRSYLRPQISGLCLLGFSDRWPVTVTLTAPDGTYWYTHLYSTSGNVVQADPIYVPDAAQLYTEQGRTAIRLEVWFPPDLQAGKWRVMASTDQSTASQFIDIGWPNDVPQLYVPSASPNPFSRPADTYVIDMLNAGKYTLKTGESLPISGISLPAKQAIPLAVYQVLDKHNMRLVQAAMLASDGYGRISTNFTAGTQFPPGLYQITAVINFDNDYAPGIGPFIGIYINSCPGAKDSALWINDQVKINPSPPTPNNIRSGPGLRQKLVGQLSLRQTATILEGPVCADKMVWWKVKTSAGITGWTSEGQGQTPWLVRIPPETPKLKVPVP